MIYFDSNYLVRLYYKDQGFATVRELAVTAPVACAQHGRAEVVAALHRKRREGALTANLYAIALEEFFSEIRAGAFNWLPLSPAVFDRIQRTYVTLPSTIFLRAADAVHLACAAENGFREIYSNDQHLLAAASHFGLRGRNVI